MKIDWGEVRDFSGFSDAVSTFHFIQSRRRTLRRSQFEEAVRIATDRLCRSVTPATAARIRDAVESGEEVTILFPKEL